MLCVICVEQLKPWCLLRAERVIGKWDAGRSQRSQTLFRTPVAGLGIDLRTPPFDASRAAWTDPADYAACQAMARDARKEGIQLIRYASVRDPQSGTCAAVLAHAAFAASQPVETESWMLVVARQHVIWRHNSVFDDGAFEFDAGAWSGTPLSR